MELPSGMRSIAELKACADPFDKLLYASQLLEFVFVQLDGLSTRHDFKSFIDGKRNLFSDPNRVLWARMIRNHVEADGRYVSQREAVFAGEAMLRALEELVGNLNHVTRSAVLGDDDTVSGLQQS